MFSAKGAAFNVEPGATSQDSWRIQTSALKARFTVAQVQELNEARLQRLFTDLSKFLGRCPRLKVK
jgi:hypothetical protein